MKKIISAFAFAALFFVTACQQNNSSEYSAGFVTLLGSDTLAVEQFKVGQDAIVATVVLRAPRTSLRTYTLQTSNGEFVEMTRESYDPSTGEILENNNEKIYWEGDSLVRQWTNDNGTQTRKMTASKDVLPFVDMVHWPYEIALMRAYKGEGDSLSQGLIAGNRVRPFIIAKTGDRSLSLRHPSRGVMQTTVTENGGLESLDASATTRKLLVSRVESVDALALAKAFSAKDAAGKSFGALSTRGQDSTGINGATIKVDFGRPAKRGREIYGKLVAYGERWRTGANRATHFSTDQDLQFGECAVPAGEYTLSTIPEEDGGILIINKQTGQGGTTYNQDQDLCRVAMNRSEGELVEIFSIEVVETESGGEIRLLWDTTVLSIPFTVGSEGA